MENIENALVNAVTNGELKTVQDINDSGFDVNAKLNETTCQTALHIASMSGHLNVVEYLISKKANVDDFENSKQTPLHLASSKGHCMFVKTWS